PSKPPVCTPEPAPPGDVDRLDDAIARHARDVVYERAPPSGEAVEERGLPDLRAAHDRDQGSAGCDRHRCGRIIAGKAAEQTSLLDNRNGAQLGSPRIWIDVAPSRGRRAAGGG